MAKNITSKNMNVDRVQTEMNERIKKPEHILGRSLIQPFCNTNSGSRKLMHSTHLEQRLALLNPEVPIIQTGYENEFGKYASSVQTADDDLVVLKKIQKFTDNPNHHYFLIVQNTRTGELDYIEKINYEFITETYGYLFNNDKLDKLEPIDPSSQNIDDSNIINKGEIYKKSMAYDEFNNRRDGVNLLTAYLSTEKNTEDSVIISEEAKKKLSSPLIKPVTIIVNDNDILLNIYGDLYNYKTFPDIGEDIVDNLLSVVRREKKEESLYTHSFDRLQDFLMNDDKFIVSGKVIDIDVYCNNPETIDNSPYNVQIKKYKDNKLRYLNEFVYAVRSIHENNGEELPMSDKLKEFLFNANRVLEGVQYINERPFTGTILKITILEENEIKVGDKVSDRYGGKGVVSFILPKEEMPIIEDTGEPVDIVFNACTCVGRLNPGQMFETSTTFIGKRIIDYILLNVLDPDQCLELVREYFQMTGSNMDEFLEDLLDPNNSEFIKEEYLNSIVKDNGIYLSLEPISNSMTIDTLGELYDEFSWIRPYNMIMPIRNSNGKIRHVRSRRPMIIGNKYIYRLKQYGEDKFSVTSLSATNIKNQNTRSKSSKQYKASCANTPIRAGDMEIANLCHMGPEYVACMVMMYSSSPHARRSTQKLYTGDPFDINIKLDNKAKNRNAEIIDTRLKTCGYRLVFKKVPKKLKSVIRPMKKDVIRRFKEPIRRIKSPIRKVINPIKRLDKE